MTGIHRNRRGYREPYPWRRISLMAAEDKTLTEVSEVVGLTVATLSRAIKIEYGVGWSEYKKLEQGKEAKRLKSKTILRRKGRC